MRWGWTSCPSRSRWPAAAAAGSRPATSSCTSGWPQPFAAAAKAHPALRASSARALRELADALAAAGHLVEWDDALAGAERFYVHDPFGNRVEIIAAAGSDGSAGTA